MVTSPRFRVGKYAALVGTLAATFASSGCSPFPEFHVVDCVEDADCAHLGGGGFYCERETYSCVADVTVALPSVTSSLEPEPETAASDAGAPTVISPVHVAAPQSPTEPVLEVPPEGGQGTSAPGPDAGDVTALATPLNLFEDPEFDQDPLGTAWGSDSFFSNSTLSWFDMEAALVEVGWSAEIWATQLNQYRQVQLGEEFTVSFRVRAVGPLGTEKAVIVHIIEEGFDYSVFAYSECQVGIEFETCTVTGVVAEAGLVKFGIQGGASDVDFVVDSAQLTQH
jgi:hypothetical protein